MARYRIDIEIFEGKGGQMRREGGRTIPLDNPAREGICAWMYRGDGLRSYQAGEQFAYPDDAGRICPWLLSAMDPLIQTLRYGGTLTWRYEGTPYEKVIDADGITTEYVRCPDPSASGIVAKLIRTKVED